MDRTRNTLVVGLLAASLLWLLMSTPAAANTSGTMTISTDTALTKDHDGNIVIAADGVTLDCAGHTVTGTGSGIGILQDSRTGVAIKNCNVTQFATGFHVNASSAILLTGNTATNTDQGFRIATSTNVTLTDNTGNDNTSWGFILAQGTNNSTLTGNTANDNDKIGFAWTMLLITNFNPTRRGGTPPTSTLSPSPTETSWRTTLPGEGTSDST